MSPKNLRRKLTSQSFLARPGPGKTVLKCPNKYTIFSQGDKANAVFYVQAGKVKLTVLSDRGKEAVVAGLDAGDFLANSV